MTPGDAGRDDRVLRATRWLAALIIPVLVGAFLILFGLPTETERLWAWTIRPTMTPMLMGAGYLAGAYFFLRVLIEPQWHRVTLGFPAVATFATCMALATVLHWDRFNYAHPAFWAWVALYATTPVIVLVVWLRNRRTDPRTLEADDLATRAWFRWAMAIAGLMNICAALVLVASPGLMIAIWPWQLTPLTARIIGGWFALPGVVAVVVALERRWSAARIVLQAKMFGIVLILVGVARAWPEFNLSAVTTWLFVGGLAGLLALSAAGYAAMEVRRTSATRRLALMDTRG